jgi:hypothetical protein
LLLQRHTKLVDWFSQIVTIRSRSRYGSGSSITPRTTLTVADVAPIPSARARIAGTENRGARTDERSATRRSSSRVLMSAASTHQRGLR